MTEAIADIQYVNKKIGELRKIINDRLIINGDKTCYADLHKTLSFGEDTSDKEAHNCIFCNLGLNARFFIDQVLALSLRKGDSEVSSYLLFRTFYIELYIFVVNIESILSILHIHDQYTKDRFKIFGRIKRWANFIKHPKAFMLVHHPEFQFEDDRCPVSNTNIIIDQQFIDKYYSNPSRDSELYNKMSNQRGVRVTPPNPTETLSAFCDANDEFIRLVKNNEMIRFLLREKGTYSNFFLNPEKPDLPQQPGDDVVADDEQQ